MDRFVQPGVTGTETFAERQTNARAAQAIVKSPPSLRLMTFAIVESKVTDAAYWYMLGTLWIDAKVIWPHLDIWRNYFQADRADRHHLMKPEEHAKLAKLADFVEVFRVTDHPEDCGISYTTRPSVCKRLSRDMKEPRLIRHTVHKDAIFAFFTRRGEHEVILL